MKRGTLFVLGCYVIWGFLPVFWKQLDLLSALYVLASRILWSLVFTAVILLLRRDRFAPARRALRDRMERRRLMAAGVVVCVNWGLYIWAVSGGHILDSSLAYYMNPILAILIGTLAFQERLSRLQWLAVAAVCAGLAVTVVRSGRFPWLALAIGGSFAVYGALKKKVRSDAVTATFVETLTTAPLFLLLVLWMERRGMGAVGMLHGWQWVLLPLSGIVTTVPLLLYGAGMKTTPMTLSGILMYINPTLQFLISVLLYHEEFTTTHALLFAFVWSGLALYLLSGLRRSPEKEEHPCA